MKFLGTFLLLHPTVLFLLDGSVVFAALQNGGPKRPAKQQQPTAQSSPSLEPSAVQNTDSGFMSKIIPTIKTFEGIVAPAFETTGLQEDFTELVSALNELSQEALQLLGVSDNPTDAEGAMSGTGVSQQQQTQRKPLQVSQPKRQSGQNTEAEDDFELPGEWRKWTAEEQELM